jgi:WD40 repeat protein
MLARPAVALALLALALPARAAQPQFWRMEGARDFLDGEVQDVSVDSEGRVRLSPASRLLNDPEVPQIWCLATDGKGRIFAGTGNDGKVFRIDAGRGQPLFDSAELEVHALAWGPDGRLYVGTSPDGKVYAVDEAGTPETFYDPADKYIWSLAFDRSGNLFVATGSEGRIHRVDRKGAAQVVFTSPETHLLSLALDGKGNLYAGSSPGGVVYRIDPALKVFVVHDSTYREAKALDAGPDGSVYVAAVDGKDKEESARPPATTLPAIAPVPGGEVTVTESFSAIPPIPGAVPGATRTVEAPRPGTAKGAVLRILPSGEVDTLWSTSEETPHALVHTPEGVLVGTGDKGKLFLVRDDRTWSMLKAFASEQVTALAKRPGEGALAASSNPGKVFALESAPALTGTFTSKVKDAETVSSWGRVSWDAVLPAGTALEVQTRSGNTGSPDSTWSDWSPPYQRREGDLVTSERARFIQVRATLEGKERASPQLDGVSVAYLQRNLRPQVTSISVHAPGEVFQKPISISGELEILGLEGGPAEGRAPAAVRPAMPPPTSYSRKLFQKGIQTFTWKAEDANGDTLGYDVHYRAVGETRFRTLRKGLTEAVLAWDTSTVPNGRYVIRVTATDAPSNPGPLALSTDKESLPFDVDNTPPLLGGELLQKSPARVRVTARDDASLIRKAEYAVDGGRWEEIHPTDGINDSLEEVYEFQPVRSDPGPHVVVVRVTDQLGNVATAKVETP